MNTESVKQAMSESFGRSTGILANCSIDSQVQRKLQQWDTCHFCGSPSVCVLGSKQLRQLIGVCKKHKLEHSNIKEQP